ncbi:MAG: hypothetical protein ACRCX2_13930 [Paraclostridium sp.]
MKQKSVKELIKAFVGYGVDTVQINSATPFRMPTNNLIKDNDYNAGEEDVKRLIIKPDRLLKTGKPSLLYDAVYHINNLVHELPEYGASEMQMPRIDMAEDYNAELNDYRVFLYVYNKCLQLLRSEGTTNQTVSTVFDNSGINKLGNIKCMHDSRETTWYDCVDKLNRLAKLRGEFRAKRLKAKFGKTCYHQIMDRINSELEEIKELPSMLVALQNQMISALTKRYFDMKEQKLILGDISSYVELLDTEGKLITSVVLTELLINLGIKPEQTTNWIKNYKRKRENALQFTSIAELEKFCKHQIQIRNKYIATYNKDKKELKGKERKEEYESELTKEFRAKFMGEDKVELTKRDKNEVYSCPMLQTEILIKDGKYYEVRWGSMPKEISRAKASEILTEENKLNPEYKETIIR